MSDGEQARVICKYIVDSEWRARSVWTISRLFSKSDYEEVITYFELLMEGGR